MLGSNVSDKSLTNAPPTRLLTTPLQPTARPRKLFAVEQSATRANHPIIEMTARTAKNLSRLEWMC